MESRSGSGLIDDDIDIDGVQEEHEEVIVSDHTKNEIEDEVDPLDAYMASIEAEVQQTAFEDKQRQLKRQSIPYFEKDLQDDDIQDEEADDEDNKKPAGDTTEDILAMAQLVAKKKDLTVVDHAEIRYEPLRKDFYIEVAEISGMGEEEVEAYRQELDGIKIRGKDCPKPIKKWTQCGLDIRVLEAIKKAGYEKPTPIQAQSIPAIMKGRDIIGIAKTGSGKTVAFLLPMIRHVLDQRKLSPTEGPIALIMTPTRELAMQIHGEAVRFSKALGLRSVCACGGAPIKDQIGDLKRGAEILVCTPGRLIELLVANSGRVTNLRRVTYLVLDEADRMFDMGFGPQVLKVVGNVRPDKQAVLFSATFPRQMEALARKVLHRPVEIVVGGRSVVCGDVTQVVEVLEEGEKFIRLLAILGEWYPEKASKILIFVDKQDAADNLLNSLLKRGYPSLSIHGGKDQDDRDSALEDFKSGIAPILVATSVAARGLDVKDLKLVINYECPNHMEDYVHRVGRTGRAGQKGTAYTFITGKQSAYASDIAKALKASDLAIPDALQHLVEEHQKKVKEGLAHTSSSGFGGKGLENIDKEHERARKVQKRSALGEEASSDEEDEAILQLVESTTESGPASSMITPQVKPQSHPHQQTPPPQQQQQHHQQQQKSLPQEALAAIRQLNAKMGTSVSVDPLAELNKRYARSTTEAGAQLGEIIPVYAPIPAGTDPSTTPTIRSYFCEIDINDFPQIVRFRITHKDTTGSLQEYSGAACLIRGEYVPAGKTPAPGQRRLYIRLDAESCLAVEKARAEVKRLLTQFTMEAASKGSIDFSRYEL